VRRAILTIAFQLSLQVKFEEKNASPFMDAVLADKVIGGAKKEALPLA